MSRLDDIETRLKRLTRYGDPSVPWSYDGGGHGPKLRTDQGTWVGDVPSAVWTCDDVEDGCPDIAAEWDVEGQFLSNAPADLDYLLAIARAAEALIGAGYWTVDEGPSIRADGVQEWYCVPEPLYSALLFALDTQRRKA